MKKPRVIQRLSVSEAFLIQPPLDAALKADAKELGLIARSARRGKGKQEKRVYQIEDLETHDIVLGKHRLVGYRKAREYIDKRLYLRQEKQDRERQR